MPRVTITILRGRDIARNIAGMVCAFIVFPVVPCNIFTALQMPPIASIFLLCFTGVIGYTAAHIGSTLWRTERTS